MFRDGAEYRSWRRTVPETVGTGANASTPAVGNLQLKQVSGNNWQVTFTPVANSLTTAEQVFVAVLGNELNNDVRRGENAGRLLEHDFVVLNLEQAPLAAAGSSDSSAKQATFALDTSITAKPALAAWVVDANGNPLQAVGGELQTL